MREEGDTIGGAVRCEVKGVPVGVGEPIFNKVQVELASAMMSIPAVKGFEYGLGMSAASVQGTESNDEMLIKKGKVRFNTNRAGGLLGGITTGEPIYFRVAFKPVSSISVPQRTVTDSGQAVALQVSGRHDVCVAPRAVAVVRAMTAIAIMDQILLRNKG